MSHETATSSSPELTSEEIAQLNELLKKLSVEEAKELIAKNRKTNK